MRWCLHATSTRHSLGYGAEITSCHVVSHLSHLTEADVSIARVAHVARAFAAGCASQRRWKVQARGIDVAGSGGACILLCVAYTCEIDSYIQLAAADGTIVQQLLLLSFWRDERNCARLTLARFGLGVDSGAWLADTRACAIFKVVPALAESTGVQVLARRVCVLRNGESGCCKKKHASSTCKRPRACTWGVHA